MCKYAFCKNLKQPLRCFISQLEIFQWKQNNWKLLPAHQFEPICTTQIEKFKQKKPEIEYIFRSNSQGTATLSA